MPARIVSRCLSLAVIAASLALAACDGPRVYKSSYAGHASAPFIDSLVAQGTNATIIRNNPFPNDPDNAAVFRAIKATYAGGRYKFVLGQPASDWNGYTMVVTFGDNILGSTDSCKNPNPPLRPGSADRISVIIEYCIGPALITQVRGNRATVSGPQDPLFGRLLDDMVADLFNPRLSNKSEPSTDGPACAPC